LTGVDKYVKQIVSGICVDLTPFFAVFALPFALFALLVFAILDLCGALADMKQPADNDGQIARGVSGRATGDSGSAKTSGSAKW